MLLQAVLVGGVDLVAMAVALGNLGRAAIDLRDPAAALEHGWIGAEPHRAAEVAVLRTPLELVAPEPLRHQLVQRLRRRPEFGRVGLGYSDEIARRFDHGHLHAEADAEIRHVALPCELCGPDLAFRATLAKTTGHQDAVDML